MGVVKGDEGNKSGDGQQCLPDNYGQYPPYEVTRSNFLRRNKPTTVPVTIDANAAVTDNIETITNKYNSRGNSTFKSQKDSAEKDVDEKKREEENDAEIQTRRPYLNRTAARNDQTTPRNFTRRRLGGAYTTSRSISSTTAAPISRRPFRVASRRRPAVTTKTTSTTSTQSTTDILDSEEFLQDIEETDSIEDPSKTSGSNSKNRKIQRRPLVSLKIEEDQNPAATSEEEKKRQSKKYSSSFKQNQLDEVLRLKAQDTYDVDIDSTTDGKVTVENYSAETAVALAAHKLLEAPVPIVHDYEYEEKSSRSTLRNTKKLNYTTDYNKEVKKTPSYPISYTTTPNYNTATQNNNIQTSTDPVISSDLLETLLPSTRAFKASQPAGFTAPTITNPGLSGVSRILSPSTVRYLSTTDQNTATHNINPLDDRYIDNNEKYLKAPPSTIQYVSTVNKYSGVSYDSTPTDRYVDISETSQTLSRTDSTRNRRPTTGRNFPNTETPQTLPPPTPSTNRYIDTNNGFTGIPQGSSVTHEYTSSSDKYTDGFQTAGPSTIDYLDSTRYTGISQRLNPTNRFTVTSDKFTDVSRDTNPSTYFEDGMYTRISQDETPVNSFIGTSDTELPPNTVISTNKYTDTNERYTTVQNLSPTYTYTEISDKYKSISRRRKPSTTSTENENVTTETQQRSNPTNRYSSNNERYTKASRRRRPSTNAESEKYTTGTLQNISPTEDISSTTGGSVASRKRKPSTKSYTEQPATEPSTTFGFTVTSAYTNAPRRTRPMTTKYTDVITDTPVILQNSAPTTELPDISEKFTETSSTIRPSTDIYSETFEKITETPFISTDTVIASKKYSEVSRSPSTSTYTESVEKHEELNEDDVSTDRYFTPNGQYTGILQDHQSSTTKHFSTEERSQSVSPTSIKYPSTTDKYVSGPIDDFSYSTVGYSQSQEPSHFTREYLLASPVTKTYDDEYQYLSPVNSNQPSSTTRKLARKKTVFRRISTTASPSSTTTTTTPKPRRVASRKPFEKIQKVQKEQVLKKQPVQQEQQLVSEEQPVKEIQTAQRVQTVQRVKPVKKVEMSEPNTVIRPIGSYDYYDDSEEKVIQKYEEETKVILHGKATYESISSSTVAPISRHPFRVAIRRRPVVSTNTTSTANTTQSITIILDNEKLLKNIEGPDSIEDISTTSTSNSKNHTIHKRPPITLKVDQNQNHATTSEEEKNRQSKSYSSSFKQNQLDEVQRQRQEFTETSSAVRPSTNIYSETFEKIGPLTTKYTDAIRNTAGTLHNSDQTTGHTGISENFTETTSAVRPSTDIYSETFEKTGSLTTKYTDAIRDTAGTLQNFGRTTGHTGTSEKFTETSSAVRPSTEIHSETFEKTRPLSTKYTDGIRDTVVTLQNSGQTTGHTGISEKFTETSSAVRPSTEIHSETFEKTRPLSTKYTDGIRDTVVTLHNSDQTTGHTGISEKITETSSAVRPSTEIHSETFEKTRPLSTKYTDGIRDTVVTLQNSKISEKFTETSSAVRPSTEIHSETFEKTRPLSTKYTDGIRDTVVTLQNSGQTTGHTSISEKFTETSSAVRPSTEIHSETFEKTRPLSTKHTDGIRDTVVTLHNSDQTTGHTGISEKFTETSSAVRPSKNIYSETFEKIGPLTTKYADAITDTVVTLHNSGQTTGHAGISEKFTETSSAVRPSTEIHSETFEKTRPLSTKHTDGFRDAVVTLQNSKISEKFTETSSAVRPSTEIHSETFEKTSPLSTKYTDGIRDTVVTLQNSGQTTGHAGISEKFTKTSSAVRPSTEIHSETFEKTRPLSTKHTDGFRDAVVTLQNSGQTTGHTGISEKFTETSSAVRPSTNIYSEKFEKTRPLSTKYTDGIRDTVVTLQNSGQTTGHAGISEKFTETSSAVRPSTEIHSETFEKTRPLSTKYTDGIRDTIVTLQNSGQTTGHTGISEKFTETSSAVRPSTDIYLETFEKTRPLSTKYTDGIRDTVVTLQNSGQTTGHTGISEKFTETSSAVRPSTDIYLETFEKTRPLSTKYTDGIRDTVVTLQNSGQTTGHTGISEKFTETSSAVRPSTDIYLETFEKTRPLSTKYTDGIRDTIVTLQNSGQTTGHTGISEKFTETSSAVRPSTGTYSETFEKTIKTPLISTDTVITSKKYSEVSLQSSDQTTGHTGISEKFTETSSAVTPSTEIHSETFEKTRPLSTKYTDGIRDTVVTLHNSDQTTDHTGISEKFTETSSAVRPSTNIYSETFEKTGPLTTKYTDSIRDTAGTLQNFGRTTGHTGISEKFTKTSSKVRPSTGTYTETFEKTIKTPLISTDTVITSKKYSEVSLQNSDQTTGHTGISEKFTETSSAVRPSTNIYSETFEKIGPLTTKYTDAIRDTAGTLQNFGRTTTHTGISEKITETTSAVRPLTEIHSETFEKTRPLSTKYTDGIRDTVVTLQNSGQSTGHTGTSEKFTETSSAVRPSTEIHSETFEKTRPLSTKYTDGIRDTVVTLQNSGQSTGHTGISEKFTGTSSAVRPSTDIYSETFEKIGPLTTKYTDAIRDTAGTLHNSYQTTGHTGTSEKFTETSSAVRPSTNIYSDTFEKTGPLTTKYTDAIGDTAGTLQNFGRTTGHTGISEKFTKTSSKVRPSTGTYTETFEKTIKTPLISTDTVITSKKYSEVSLQNSDQTTGHTGISEKFTETSSAVRPSTNIYSETFEKIGPLTTKYTDAIRDTAGTLQNFGRTTTHTGISEKITETTSAVRPLTEIHSETFEKTRPLSTKYTDGIRDTVVTLQNSGQSTGHTGTSEKFTETSSAVRPSTDIYSETFEKIGPLTTKYTDAIRDTAGTLHNSYQTTGHTGISEKFTETSSAVRPSTNIYSDTFEKTGPLTTKYTDAIGDTAGTLQNFGRTTGHTGISEKFTKTSSRVRPSTGTYSETFEKTIKTPLISTDTVITSKKYSEISLQNSDQTAGHTGISEKFTETSSAVRPSTNIYSETFEKIGPLTTKYTDAIRDTAGTLQNFGRTTTHTGISEKITETTSAVRPLTEIHSETFEKTRPLSTKYTDGIRDTVVTLQNSGQSTGHTGTSEKFTETSSAVRPSTEIHSETFEKTRPLSTKYTDGIRDTAVTLQNSGQSTGHTGISEKFTETSSAVRPSTDLYSETFEKIGPLTTKYTDAIRDTAGTLHNSYQTTGHTGISEKFTETSSAVRSSTNIYSDTFEKTEPLTTKYTDAIGDTAGTLQNFGRTTGHTGISEKFTKTSSRVRPSTGTYSETFEKTIKTPLISTDTVITSKKYSEISLQNSDQTAGHTGTREKFTETSSAVRPSTEIHSETFEKTRPLSTKYTDGIRDTTVTLQNSDQTTGHTGISEKFTETSSAVRPSTTKTPTTSTDTVITSKKYSEVSRSPSTSTYVESVEKHTELNDDNVSSNRYFTSNGQYTGIVQDHQSSTAKYFTEEGSQSVSSSSVKYPSTTDKYVSGPIYDFSYSTAGYSQSQEPSNYKVLKTQTVKKEQQLVAEVQPVRKIETSEPSRAIKPIGSHNYYGNSEEKIIQKYEEEAKVILHGNDSIETPSLTSRSNSKNHTMQRRPLISLNQNASATSEEEKNRQSKNYNSSFKLDEVQRLKTHDAYDVDIDPTTNGKFTVKNIHTETFEKTRPIWTKYADTNRDTTVTLQGSGQTTGHTDISEKFTETSSSVRPSTDINSATFEKTRPIWTKYADTIRDTTVTLQNSGQTTGHTGLSEKFKETSSSVRPSTDIHSETFEKTRPLSTKYTNTVKDTKVTLQHSGQTTGHTGISEKYTETSYSVSPSTDIHSDTFEKTEPLSTKYTDTVKDTKVTLQHSGQTTGHTGLSEKYKETSYSVSPSTDIHSDTFEKTEPLSTKYTDTVKDTKVTLQHSGQTTGHTGISEKYTETSYSVSPSTDIHSDTFEKTEPLSTKYTDTVKDTKVTLQHSGQTTGHTGLSEKFTETSSSVKPSTDIHSETFEKTRPLSTKYTNTVKDTKVTLQHSGQTTGHTGLSEKFTETSSSVRPLTDIHSETFEKTRPLRTKYADTVRDTTVTLQGSGQTTGHTDISEKFTETSSSVRPSTDIHSETFEKTRPLSTKYTNTVKDTKVTLQHSGQTTGHTGISEKFTDTSSSVRPSTDIHSETFEKTRPLSTKYADTVKDTKVTLQHSGQTTGHTGISEKYTGTSSSVRPSTDKHSDTFEKTEPLSTKYTDTVKDTKVTLQHSGQTTGHTGISEKYTETSYSVSPSTDIHSDTFEKTEPLSTKYTDTVKDTKVTLQHSGQTTGHTGLSEKFTETSSSARPSTGIHSETFEKTRPLSTKYTDTVKDTKGTLQHSGQTTGHTGISEKFTETSSSVRPSTDIHSDTFEKTEPLSTKYTDTVKDTKVTLQHSGQTTGHTGLSEKFTETSSSVRPLTDIHSETFEKTRPLKTKYADTVRDTTVTLQGSGQTTGHTDISEKFTESSSSVRPSTDIHSETFEKTRPLSTKYTNTVKDTKVTLQHSGQTTGHTGISEKYTGTSSSVRPSTDIHSDTFEKTGLLSTKYTDTIRNATVALQNSGQLTGHTGISEKFTQTSSSVRPSTDIHSETFEKTRPLSTKYTNTVKDTKVTLQHSGQNTGHTGISEKYTGTSSSVRPSTDIHSDTFEKTEPLSTKYTDTVKDTEVTLQHSGQTTGHTGISEKYTEMSYSVSPSTDIHSDTFEKTEPLSTKYTDTVKDTKVKLQHSGQTTGHTGLSEKFTETSSSVRPLTDIHSETFEKTRPLKTKYADTVRDTTVTLQGSGQTTGHTDISEKFTETSSSVRPSTDIHSETFEKTRPLSTKYTNTVKDTKVTLQHSGQTTGHTSISEKFTDTSSSVRPSTDIHSETFEKTRHLTTKYADTVKDNKVTLQHSGQTTGHTGISEKFTETSSSVRPSTDIHSETFEKTRPLSTKYADTVKDTKVTLQHSGQTTGHTGISEKLTEMSSSVRPSTDIHLETFEKTRPLSTKYANTVRDTTVTLQGSGQTTGHTGISEKFTKASSSVRPSTDIHSETFEKTRPLSTKYTNTVKDTIVTLQHSGQTTGHTGISEKFTETSSSVRPSTDIHSETFEKTRPLSTKYTNTVKDTKVTLQHSGQTTGHTGISEKFTETSSSVRPSTDIHSETFEKTRPLSTKYTNTVKDTKVTLQHSGQTTGHTGISEKFTETSSSVRPSTDIHSETFEKTRPLSTKYTNTVKDTKVTLQHSSQTNGHTGISEKYTGTSSSVRPSTDIHSDTFEKTEPLSTKYTDTVKDTKVTLQHSGQTTGHTGLSEKFTETSSSVRPLTDIHSETFEKTRPLKTKYADTVRDTTVTLQNSGQTTGHTGISEKFTETSSSVRPSPDIHLETFEKTRPLSTKYANTVKDTKVTLQHSGQTTGHTGISEKYTETSSLVRPSTDIHSDTFEKTGLLSTKYTDTIRNATVALQNSGQLTGHTGISEKFTQTSSSVRPSTDIHSETFEKTRPLWTKYANTNRDTTVTLQGSGQIAGHTGISEKFRETLSSVRPSTDIHLETFEKTRPLSTKYTDTVKDTTVTLLNTKDTDAITNTIVTLQNSGQTTGHMGISEKFTETSSSVRPSTDIHSVLFEKNMSLSTKYTDTIKDTSGTLQNSGKTTGHTGISEKFTETSSAVRPSTTKTPIISTDTVITNKKYSEVSRSPSTSTYVESVEKDTELNDDNVSSNRYFTSNGQYTGIVQDHQDSTARYFTKEGSKSISPSFIKYPSATDKYVSGPIYDFSYSTTGYSQRQEPSNFRVLNTQTVKKEQQLVSEEQPVKQVQTAHRVATVHGIQLIGEAETSEPIGSLNYNDDSEEKVIQKYEKERKVILHGKATSGSSPSTTEAPISRRPFRVVSRRRPVATTNTTSTSNTTQSTTNILDRLIEGYSAETMLPSTGTIKASQPAGFAAIAKITNVSRSTNQPTATYFEDSKYTRESQDETAVNSFIGTNDTKLPFNTGISTNKYTNTNERYTTLQKQSSTYTNAKASDKYKSISQRIKPSTTSTENENVTSKTQHKTNPTNRYSSTNERYAEASSRRRPSTNISTEQPTTESSTFGFNVTSAYTNAPRRTKPLTETDAITDTTVTLQNSGSTTGLTGISEKFTETSSAVRPSTDIYSETFEKTIKTPLISTETVIDSKKYSEVSRSPSTSTHVESVEKHTELNDDNDSSNRYFTSKGQYTGIVQDHQSSTGKYFRTDEGSQNISPSSIKYPSTTDKYVTGPINDFSYSTAGYSQSQEPSYFKVLKTQSVQKEQQLVSQKQPVKQVQTSQRVQTVQKVQPVKKVETSEPNKVNEFIGSHNYNDDSEEKIMQKYEEETKVILHGKATSGSSPSPTEAPISRRPFRVVSRRRPVATTNTTSTSNTTQSTTNILDRLIEDSVEDSSITSRSNSKYQTIQRRPLISLKVEQDQNSTAISEEEKNRQSKSYSSSFKQNQLDEVQRLKAQGSKNFTVESYRAETMLPSTAAIKASQPADLTATTIINPGLSGASSVLGPSTVRHLSTTDKNTAAHNINPIDDILTDTSGKNSKAPLSTIRYVSTVNKYSGVSNDLTSNVDTSETSQTLSRTDSTQYKRPTTGKYFPNTETPQTYPPTDINIETSEKNSQVPRLTNPPTDRYFDTNNGYTGTPQGQSVTNKYTSSSDKHTDESKKAGTSTTNYSHSTRYTGISQRLNPTNRLTVTSNKYTNVSRGANQSTLTYSEDSKNTSVSQDEIPVNNFTSTNDTKLPLNIGTFTQKYTNTNRTETSEKYKSISQRTKASTTSSENENVTTKTQQKTNPTNRYSSTNERYTDALRRRRPSTNISTEQPTTESSTFGFTNAPRKTRPLTTKNTDKITDTTGTLQNSDQTTRHTSISEKFTKKYSEVSRSPSTGTYVKSVEKHTGLNDDNDSSNRYLTSNGQYTGIVQDHQSSTGKYFRTEEGSQSINPSSIKYLSTTDKYVSGPIYDFSYSTAGSSQSQEPSNFKVFKTQSVQKEQHLVSEEQPVKQVQIAQRVQAVQKIQPVRKIETSEPNRATVSIGSHNYNDDSEEKIIQKSEEEAKVILHGKATSESVSSTTVSPIPRRPFRVTKRRRPVATTNTTSTSNTTQSATNILDGFIERTATSVSNTTITVAPISRRPFRVVRRGRPVATTNATSTTNTTQSIPNILDSEEFLQNNKETANSESISSTTVSPIPRRTFRVIKRRRPVATTNTTSISNTTQSTTNILDGFIERTDSIGDSSIISHSNSKNQTIERRPLISLKVEHDHNLDATSEEEKNRQSKSYSSSFKQNQLDEVQRLNVQGSRKFTVESHSASTMLPSTGTIKAPQPSGFTATTITTNVSRNTNQSNATYFEENKYTKISQDETPVNSFIGKNDTELSFNTGISTNKYTNTNERYTTVQKLSSTYTNAKASDKYTSILQRTKPSTTSTENENVTTKTQQTPNQTNIYSSTNERYTESSRRRRPSTNSSTEQPTTESSTFGFTVTSAYTDAPRKTEPLTTKETDKITDTTVTLQNSGPTTTLTGTSDGTYDDDLSPVTSNQPSTTTRKVARKKTVLRRISTTARPSLSTTTTTTPWPRTVVSKESVQKEQNRSALEKLPVKQVQPTQRVQTAQRVQPVRKIETSEPNRAIRLGGGNDYYNKGEEKVIQKQEKKTKFIFHGRRNIECLDIGDFPHPSSCKKFISCARIKSGVLRGTEYNCPTGLLFDPVSSICNYSADVRCNEQNS